MQQSTDSRAEGSTTSAALIVSMSLRRSGRVSTLSKCESHVKRPHATLVILIMPWASSRPSTLQVHG